MKNHSEIKAKISSLNEQYNELESNLKEVPLEQRNNKFEMDNAKKEGDEITFNSKKKRIEQLDEKIKEWKSEKQNISEELIELRAMLKHVN